MRRLPAIYVTAALSLSACGGAQSLRNNAGQAAAIAAELAAASAIAVLTHRSRRQIEDGSEASDPEPDHAPPIADVGDTEPALPRPRPLPLWHVPYAVELNAEDLWCDHTADCVRLESVDGCQPASGGVDVALRQASLARLRAELADADPSRACPGQPDASRDAEVACVDNLCRLLPGDRLGPVPPPPGAPAHAGLPPVPPPP